MDHKQYPVLVAKKLARIWTNDIYGLRYMQSKACVPLDGITISIQPEYLYHNSLHYMILLVILLKMVLETTQILRWNIKTILKLVIRHSLVHATVQGLQAY